MRSLFLVFLVSASLGFGQQTLKPDCVLPFSFSSSGVSPVFDNTLVACQTWTVDYQASSTGSISSLSLAFQSADGTTTPGTFGSYGGTTSTGNNPATNTTGEVSTFTNGTTVISFVRMSLTLTASGVTTVNGTLYGYKTGYPGGGGGGGGGCVGTSATPCVVMGR